MWKLFFVLLLLLAPPGSMHSPAQGFWLGRRQVAWFEQAVSASKAKRYIGAANAAGAGVGLRRL